MRINVKAAEAVEQESQAKRLVLPKGRYVVKIPEAEDKAGNEKARGLVISARVEGSIDEDTGAVKRLNEQYEGVAKSGTKQTWRVNYTKRNGEDNVYGHATANSLVKATGAAIDDGEVEVDQFEGARVEAYLKVEKARDYLDENGEPRTSPERNQATRFYEFDAKAAKAATAALKAQAEAQAKAEAGPRGGGGSIPVHGQEDANANPDFDDDIPF